LVLVVRAAHPEHKVVQVELGPADPALVEQILFSAQLQRPAVDLEQVKTILLPQQEVAAQVGAAPQITDLVDLEILQVPHHHKVIMVG
jgi:hypothetical protein